MYTVRSHFSAAAVLLALAAAAGPAAAQGFIYTSGSQKFHVGDASTTVNTITVQCSIGDMLAANNIRIIIPPGIDMEWDNNYTTDGVNGVSINDPGNHVASSVIYYSIGGKLKGCFLDITSDFLGSFCQISGLHFRNFNTVSAAATLGMDKTGDGVADVFTAQTFRIAGFPLSFSSGSSQVFAVGDSATNANQITIQDVAGANTSIFGGGFIYIRIPAGLNMQWNTGIGSITYGGSGSGNMFSFVDYPTTKIMRLWVSSDFGSSQTLIIPFTGFSPPQFQTFAGVSSGAIPLDLSVNTGVTYPISDSQTKQIVSNPTMVSTGSQTFGVGDPIATNNTITITDSAGISSITAARGIKVIIPVGLPMTWNTSDTTATFGGTGTGHLAVTPVSYPDSKTLLISLSSNFPSQLTPQTLTIDNLGFTNFAAPGTAGQFLTLELDLDGTAEATDTSSKVIGAPTISSQSNQSIAVGAGPFPCAQIVITENIAARITAAKDIRIRIPTGFNAEWDQSVTTPSLVLGGIGAGVVNGTVTYPTAKILLIDVTTGFSLPKTLTINNLAFVNTSASTPDNLELEVSNANTVADEDDKSIVVGGFPTINTGSDQFFTVNDPSTICTTFTLQEAGGTPLFTAAGNIRVHLPNGMSAVWDTTSTPTLTPAGGTGTVGGVSYEDLDTTLVIDVIAPFTVTQTLQVQNMKIRFFTAASAEGPLWLEVGNNGAQAAADPNVKGIGMPTISSQADQAFGIGDPPTTASPMTVTEDPAVERLLLGGTFRIKIPGGLDMIWDDTSAPTFTGPAATKVSLNGYSIDRKTVIFNVISGDFAPGQSATISNMKFKTFGSIGGPASLTLEITPGFAAFTDDKEITVADRPSISQAFTFDNSGNGSVDLVAIFFNKDIDGATASATFGTGFTVAGFTIYAAQEFIPGGLILQLVDLGIPNTGVTPALSYDPVTGSLIDLAGLEMSVYGPTAVQDSTVPLITGMSTQDTNGDGKLDKVVFTFSEALLAGQEDINDWMLVDADGSTNLLAGLTNAALQISGNTLTITLAGTLGTGGAPRYRYVDDGFAGALQDTSSNFIFFSTNDLTPVINAGPDLAYGPTVVQLTGSISEPDNQPFTFIWAQTAGPAVVINNPTALTPSFTGIQPGTYTFALSVTDAFNTWNDTVNIIIVNVQADVDAGFDQTVQSPSGVTLDATRTIDVNGETFGSGLSILWTQTDGPAVALANANTATPNFPTAGINDMLEFTATVTDGALNVSSSTVRVRVNSAGNAVPTADAGPDQVGRVGSPVTLDGRFSIDPEGGALAYTWTPNVLLSGPGTATPTFTPSLSGIYAFQLVVQDLAGAKSVADTVTVYVTDGNALPQAVAYATSPSADVTIGDHLVMHGHLSIDPEQRPLGYSWVQTAGPRIQVDHTAIPHADYFPVTPGTVTFRLIVTDDAQQGPPVFFTLPVKAAALNVLPHAYVAVDPADDLGGGRVSIATAPILLNGAGSTGIAITHHWTQVGGPAVVLANVNTSTPSFTPPISGRYAFTDTVIDADGVRDTATLNVIVDTPPTNSSPAADAGVDRAGVVGEVIALNGSASSDSPSDPDGLMSIPDGMLAQWSQTSGPPVQINGQTSATPSFIATAPGVYFFQLVVRDLLASSKPDTMMVVVQSALPPTDNDGGRCGLLGIEAVVVMAGLSLLRRRAAKK